MSQVAASPSSSVSGELEEVKSTGEVAEEVDGDVADDASLSRRQPKDDSASTYSVEEVDEEQPAPPPADEPAAAAADPFTRHTLTWDADTVERGVELTCQGERERERN
jgi:hypothetical protein